MNNTQRGFSTILAICALVVLGGIAAYTIDHQSQVKKELHDMIVPQSPSPAPTPTPAPTPAPKPAPAAQSGVKGTIYISPTCGVEIEGQPNSCGPKPYAGKLGFTPVDPTSKITYSVIADAQGNFKLALPVGAYMVRSLEEGLYPILSSPTKVVVVANAYTTIRVDYDSGIR